jgi:curli biogenesis system outer membrane secretion channel CsgG
MRKRPVVSCYVLAILLPAIGLAQTNQHNISTVTRVQVFVDHVNVRLEPAASAPSVTLAPIGSELQVIAVVGEWYRVRLPRDEWGFERSGYVHAEGVRPLATAGEMVAGVSSRSAVPDGKPTVAVLDFDFGTVQQWWEGNWDVGKGIADLLADRVLADGNVRLLERRRLHDVMSEQDLARSGRTESSTVERGELVGAKYLITGTVTKFGGESQNVSAAGMGGGWIGGVLGVVGLKRTYANVSISCRLVDSRTGEVLLSAEGTGRSVRKGLLLGGGAANGGKAGGAGIDMSRSDFQNTILGEATQKAVHDAATKLLALLKARPGT